MSLTIDTLLRGAKADLKAGRPLAARVSLLQALERFPENARLLAQLAEVQAEPDDTAKPLMPMMSDSPSTKLKLMLMLCGTRWVA